MTQMSEEIQIVVSGDQIRFIHEDDLAEMLEGREIRNTSGKPY